MSALEYRPSLDGLRAVAVVSVLAFHLDKNILPGGFVGVDVFFVLSGFLITSIIYSECSAGTFSLLRFYQRRISRIFPVFFLVSFAILAAASVLYTHQDFASVGALAAASSISLANMKLIFQGNYFELSPDAQPFLHFWSLSVEEQFYLVFPATLFVAVRMKLSRVWLSTLLWICAIASFASCIVLTKTSPAWAFYLLPTRAWELLLGALLAVGQSRSQEKENRSTISDWTGLAGLGCLAVSFFAITEKTSFPGYAAILPVAGTLLLIGHSPAPTRITERWLSNGALVFIGKISYSLYLWHWPVYCFTDYSLYEHSSVARIAIKLTATAALSIASYLALERPARRYLNLPRKRAIGFTMFATGMLVVLAAGINIRSTNYVDASIKNGVLDQRIFNASITKPPIILMGDSNGSMYGKAMERLSEEQNARVHVISVAAGDPFPPSSLYRLSMNRLEEEKPRVTILVAAWASKIGSDKTKMQAMLSDILEYSNSVVLITQPPQLPEAASRESIRENGMVPIFEDSEVALSRKSSNDLVSSFRSERVRVVDVESVFIQENGEIRLHDSHGRQLFQDSGHLSGFGAELVADVLSGEISAAIASGKVDLRR